jgi:hypothetical protein
MTSSIAAMQSPPKDDAAHENPEPESHPDPRPTLIVQRLVAHRLTPEERHRRISELAYKRAEQRGFAPGGEQDDWMEAEREVDAGRY